MYSIIRQEKGKSDCSQISLTIQAFDRRCETDRLKCDTTFIFVYPINKRRVGSVCLRAGR